jgi:hypothetical protein
MNLFEFSGIRLGTLKRYGKIMEAWMPSLELSRIPQGSRVYYAGKGNIGRDQYLGIFLSVMRWLEWSSHMPKTGFL